MAEHENLCIFRLCAASQQPQPGQDLPEDQIQQSYRHGRRSCPMVTVLRCCRSPLWTTSSAPTRLCLRCLWPHRLAHRDAVRSRLGLRRCRGHRDRPVQTTPQSDLTTSQADFNTALSKIRAAVEHAIAHLKTWRMISEEGGRYRTPIQKYQSMLKAVIGLYFRSL